MVAVTTTSASRRTRRSTGPTRHLSMVAAPQFRVDLGTPGGPFSTQNVLRRGRRSLPAATCRRRRVAALVVVTGLAFVAWLALGALGGVLTAPVRSTPPPAAGVGGPNAADGAVVVEVAPGDTLWSIARRLQPEGDPRPLVDRLAASNGGAVVRAGDRLVVG